MTDTIFHGGVLLAQDPASPVASALAVRDGRVAAVGRDGDVLSLAGPGTRRVHLEGRTLVPGFIDAHAHIWKIGHLLTTMVDLRKADSLAAIATRLRGEDARRPAGAWLLGRGWNEARLAEGRAPTRQDLDAAVPGRPVVLTRTCGHIMACNSAALATAGITAATATPPGGVIERDASGTPTGLISENATGLLNAAMPVPARDDYAAMIDAALRHQLSLGITSSNDAGVDSALLDTYRWMDDEQRLPSRVNVMIRGVVEGTARLSALRSQLSDFLRIDSVKFLADGGLSGATAALSVPYRHADTRGVLRFEDAELLALCRTAHDAGFRIAIHAIGDVAIDQVLRVYEALGSGPVRHRIEHLGLPSADHLRRAARLGVIAAPQAVFLHELGRNFRACLPGEFLDRAYPIRAMLDAGLTVALSSDAPVVESDDPLLGMSAAITRRTADGETLAPGQAITAAEALWAYTMGGAIASGDDTNRGSLTVGKWADLALLSDNPLTVPPEELPAVRVEQTWLGGNLVFERAA
ncbi:MAG TPA: amidohydrolase [Gemmatimonadales bacterium]